MMFGRSFVELSRLVHAREFDFQCCVSRSSKSPLGRPVPAPGGLPTSNRARQGHILSNGSLTFNWAEDGSLFVVIATCLKHHHERSLSCFFCVPVVRGLHHGAPYPGEMYASAGIASPDEVKPLDRLRTAFGQEEVTLGTKFSGNFTRKIPPGHNLRAKSV